MKLNKLRKLKERITGTMLFVFGISLLYLVLFILSPNLVYRAFIYSGGLFLKILPTFAGVIVLLFLTSLFIKPKQIKNFLGQKSKIKGWVIAIIGGILSTGPIYLWYPLLSELKEKGMRLALISTFLYNRSIKIPLLPVLVLYFGWTFTFILAIYTIIFSIINGYLLEKFVGVKK